MITWVNI